MEIAGSKRVAGLVEFVLADGQPRAAVGTDRRLAGRETSRRRPGRGSCCLVTGEGAASGDASGDAVGR